MQGRRRSTSRPGSRPDPAAAAGRPGTHSRPSPLLQQARHGLRDRRKTVVARCPGRARVAVGIEKHDEVDVARIIQFARPHLPHRQHEQTAMLFRLVGIVGTSRPRATSCRSAWPSAIRTAATARLRQRSRDLHHRPDAADIAQRDEKGGIRFHAAKREHHFGLSSRSEHVARGRLDQSLKMGVRIAGQELDQPLRVRHARVQGDRARTRQSR